MFVSSHIVNNLTRIVIIVYPGMMTQVVYACYTNYYTYWNISLRYLYRLLAYRRFLFCFRNLVKQNKILVSNTGNSFRILKDKKHFFPLSTRPIPIISVDYSVGVVTVKFICKQPYNFH
jgi:hypothetical protein